MQYSKPHRTWLRALAISLIAIAAPTVSVMSGCQDGDVQAVSADDADVLSEESSVPPAPVPPLEDSGHDEDGHVQSEDGESSESIVGAAQSDIIAFKTGDAGNAMPLPSGDWRNSIDAAIHIIESEGDWCSFSLVSSDDGEGVQYNQNIAGYSASCIKAVFCFYMLTHAQEPLDGYLLDNMESAIVYSDNDAYDMLSSSPYYCEDYIEWLAGYGIEHELYSELGNYAYLSASSLCAVWMDIADYIDEGSPEALWFSDLLSRTSMSFIRDGISDAANVWNKAGWIDDGDWEGYGLNATNDVGIVEIDGRRYILAIVTSMPYSDEAAGKVGELAHALLEIPRTDGE